MANPSLRGLQHALRTPQTRVRLTSPSPLRGTRFCRISWTGGFLDGLSIPIGPDLTALIGGRGTGKSTVIESLRFVLDQPPLGTNARQDHESVIAKVLGPGAVVRLELEKHDPTQADYVIQRTVGDPPLVLDSSGVKTQQLPSDVVGDLEVFGQHELAELAHDKNLLATLIRRLGGDFASERRRPELVGKLAKNRADLEDVERQQEALEADLAAIPRLQEQVDKFNETDLGSKLLIQREINNEQAMLDEIDRRIEGANESVIGLGLTSIAEELRTQLPAVDESTRGYHLKSAQQSLVEAADAVESAHKALTQALSIVRSKLITSRKAWEGAAEPDLENHAATMRSLVEQGYEPDAYLKTTSALSALNLRLEERKALALRHKTLLDERESKLGDLTVLDGEIATELNKAISATNEATRRKVNVRPVANPDRSSIKAVINKFFTTQRTQIIAAIDGDEFSVSNFIKAIRGGTETLRECGITGAQATNLVGHGEPLLRELEEHTVGLAVDVFLNIANDGVELRKLDELSKGQRATALLLLLLGVAKTPLVIDQPEDDLDNRFVYHGIVQHLRDLKGSRQILVTTHNANVPILGDAELVIVLESDGHRGTTAVDGVGSLDQPSIGKYAEQILEGGEEAFRARRHLYGF